MRSNVLREIMINIFTVELVNEATRRSSDVVGPARAMKAARIIPMASDADCASGASDHSAGCEDRDWCPHRPPLLVPRQMRALAAGRCVGGLPKLPPKLRGTHTDAM